MKMSRVRDLRLRIGRFIKSEAPEQFTPLSVAVTTTWLEPICQLLAVWFRCKHTTF